MTSRRALLVVASGCLVLGLSGCDGIPTTKGDKLADTVTTQLKSQGRSVDDVTCPDLKGKKGTKVTCKAKKAGKTYDVVVTATGFSKNAVYTKVNGDKVPPS